MRWNGFLTASVFVVLMLSGCLGGDDDADELQAVADCPDDDEGNASHNASDVAKGNASDESALNTTLAMLSLQRQANETGADNGTDDSDAADVVDDVADPCADENAAPAVPNVPPVADLVMTADDGTVQNGSTYILAGQNVTFSAAGSGDDDGVQLAALTVVDANGTRTVQLYDGGFVDATLSFEHDGPVNVTLRVLDGDGAFDVLETMLYVNSLQTVTIPIEFPMPAGADAGSCDYPAGEPILWQRSMNYAKFVVNSGAQWISATMTGGSGEFAICDPDKEPLSDASSDSAATERGTGGLSSSPQYSVFGVSSGTGDLSFEVLVHYEP